MRKPLNIASMAAAVSAAALVEATPGFSEAVVDPDGIAHVIPQRVIDIGIAVCTEAYDPFDPGEAPSASTMARAYVAMAHALGSFSPIPRQPSAP